jgi:hypothetical protein
VRDRVRREEGGNQQKGSRCTAVKKWKYSKYAKRKGR